MPETESAADEGSVEPDVYPSVFVSWKVFEDRIICVRGSHSMIVFRCRDGEAYSGRVGEVVVDLDEFDACGLET